MTSKQSFPALLEKLQQLQSVNSWYLTSSVYWGGFPRKLVAEGLWQLSG